jgi:transcriptional coactivator HFI1/ADA1
MPDINPADLSSRPAVNLTTPTLSNKTITVSTPSTAAKPIKTSQIIPARIDLEPIYAALKSAIGNEQWATYKAATTHFFIGKYMRMFNSALQLDCINGMLTIPTA